MPIRSHSALSKAGVALTQRLRGRVSGLCQPSYVLDIPGGYGKVPLTPSHAEPGEVPGRWRVRDPGGRVHAYPPDAELS